MTRRHFCFFMTMLVDLWLSQQPTARGGLFFFTVFSSSPEMSSTGLRSKVARYTPSEVTTLDGTH